jgi:hypothetical protein
MIPPASVNEQKDSMRLIDRPLNSINETACLASNSMTLHWISDRPWGFRSIMQIVPSR